MDTSSHYLLYSIRTRKLPEDKDLSFYKFCLQEVLSFCRTVGYLPTKILVRKDEYEIIKKQFDELGKDICVVVKGIKIPIVPASAIQIYTIQLYPVIKKRFPLFYSSQRSPQ